MAWMRHSTNTALVATADYDVQATAAECEAWAQRLRHDHAAVPTSVVEAQIRQEAIEPGCWSVEVLLRSTTFGEELHRLSVSEGRIDLTGH